jgi:hypothetical protein
MQRNVKIAQILRKVAQTLEQNSTNYRANYLGKIAQIIEQITWAK